MRLAYASPGNFVAYVEFEKNQRFFPHGSLAQLGEHLPYKQRVIGSIPITSTIYNFAKAKLPDVGNAVARRVLNIFCEMLIMQNYPTYGYSASVTRCCK